MKTYRSVSAAMALLAGLLLWPVTVARAQDPVKLAPDIYKVLLENSRVRVLDIRLAPGGKSPMHSHPSFVIYSLDGGKLRFTFPGGKSQEVELKAGEAVWSDRVTHAAENIGTTEIHVLNIELKPRRAAK